MVVEDIYDDSGIAPQVLRQTSLAAAKERVLVGVEIRLLVQPDSPQDPWRHKLLPTSLQEIG